jgi:hypothetical protein
LLIFNNLRIFFSIKTAHYFAWDFQFRKHFFDRITGLAGRGRLVDCGGAAVAVLPRASRLRRDKVTGSWWRVNADGDIGVPELDGIQKSALIIQNLESALRSRRCCE